MFRISLIVLLLSLCSSSYGQGWVITEEVKPEVKHISFTEWEDTINGYIWSRSDGEQFYESYPQYVQRTGCSSLTCSSGHCGTPSVGPVKPTGGCNCGCSAGSCNCAHSKNVYSVAAKRESAIQFGIEPLPTTQPVPKKTTQVTTVQKQSIQSLLNAQYQAAYQNCPNCSMQSRSGLFGGRIFGRR